MISLASHRKEGNSLKSINGKKLRRQYFNIPLIALFATVFLVVYSIFANSLFDKGHITSDYLSDLAVGVWVGFCFALPFTVLKVLNVYCFGRIICVLAKDGIHYPKGMVRWETVERIEYALDSKQRFKTDSTKSFRAIIYTKGGKHIVLDKAPLCIISIAKKYCKELDAKITGVATLVFDVVIFAVIILLCPFYVILLINSPGASAKQFIAFLAIAAVSALISDPLFNALAIPYRFWRRILPHKWLSYIILGGYYSSFFIIMLVLCYFPNWVTVSVLGVFLGVVRPPVPSRRGHFYRIPTYSRLFEIYIDNSDVWEKKIKKSKKRSKL